MSGDEFSAGARWVPYGGAPPLTEERRAEIAAVAERDAVTLSNARARVAADPRRALGWTRAKWTRERRAWNRSRRVAVKWIAVRAVVECPWTEAAEDEVAHAALKAAGDGWRDVPLPPGLFVGKRLPPWRTWLAMSVPYAPRVYRLDRLWKGVRRLGRRA